MGKIVNYMMAFTLTCQVIFAGSLVAPQKMQFNGKEYVLAFEHKDSSKELYEYTTDGESVQNWTKLITLIKLNEKHDLYKFLLHYKKVLDGQTPHYSTYLKGDNGYVKVIYEPTSKFQNFEANIQKLHNVDSCDGTVMLQYGVRKVVSKDMSKQDNEVALKNIYNQLKLDAEVMEQYSWKPECK
ncbi:MAG: hypothetical protein AB7D29_07905 [Campylobacterales bacterium]